jgi:hypothetical protein
MALFGRKIRLFSSGHRYTTVVSEGGSKVYPKTGNEGPEGSKGIALLFL